MNAQGLKVTPQDIINSKNVVCQKCDTDGKFSDKFQNVFIIKKVSALMSPNGKELHVPIPVFACAECGHVNSEFMPDSMQSPLDS
jgi:hypothetical protein